MVPVVIMNGVFGMVDKKDDFILTEEDETSPDAVDDVPVVDGNASDADASAAGTSDDMSYSSIASKPDHRKRNIVVITVVALLAIALTGGGLFWKKMNMDANKPDTGSRYASTSNVSDSTSASTPSLADTVKPLMKKIGVPEYYMKSHDSMSDDDRKEASSQALASSPESLTTQFTSSGTNSELTDDTSKAYNSDGTANPNYSYLTAENVSAQINDDIERIINPVYGNWVTLQMMGDRDGYQGFPLKDFADMFDPNMASDIATTDWNKARQLVPLMADWDNNAFGGQYAGWDGSLLIGRQTDDMSCTFNIQNTLDDSITCSVPVTYYGNNGSDADNPVQINKTLTITYKPNYSDNSGSSRRILIENIKQE